MIEFQTGGLLDNRTEDEKSKDFLHEEFASGDTVVSWEEKQEYKQYFPYDQNRSSSCVAGGGTITEEFFSKNEGFTFIPSRKDIYIRRNNRPSGGMAMHDLFNICIKGMAAETQVPSQGLSETPMNTEYLVTNEIVGTRAKHNFKSWVSIKNFQDENTLASIVDHTPIVAFWFFDHSEWWKVYPKVEKVVNMYGENTARHQAAIVDRTLINGKKYFVIQDTAGVGTGTGINKNIRLVDMDFIKARMFSAGYGLNNTDVQDTTKPQYNWPRVLKVGMKGDDVKKLQEVLIYEKLLNIKTPTGLFGGMTRQAVIKFQEKYAKEILTPVGLKRGTGICGGQTLKFLNKYFA